MTKTGWATSLLMGFFFSCVLMAQQRAIPSGFVYLNEVAPDVTIELRYATKDNFIGEPIDGYIQPNCIVTLEAAEALKKVQEELVRFGLGLKIFDAYRPQQAVDHFVRWANDLGDIKMKAVYYPTVAKRDLFRFGYIAEKSSHSRGSTVDLTLVDLKTGVELNMGSAYDFFSPVSWVSYDEISGELRSNRMLLQMVMDKHGFRSYSKEWWHFTFRNEPFPDTVFNFPIQ